jgi:ABC-2 type transport system ATP-binding protein
MKNKHAKRKLPHNSGTYYARSSKKPFSGSTKLLIFDEPLSGLDVVSARLFKDLLEWRAAQGKAVLYISHFLEVVEQVCNRVIVIAKGQILADAPPSDLTRLMSLPNLESVFAQLVQQQETMGIAREMVEVMQISHV